MLHLHGVYGPVCWCKALMLKAFAPRMRKAETE